MSVLTRPGRRAFTQIELVVVVAVTSVLLGMLLPSVQKARAVAQRAQCMNNLKQIGLACHNFHCLKDRLPPGYTASGPYVDGNTDTSPGWAWGAYLLPYLEQEHLFGTIDFSRPVEAQEAPKTVLNVFLCPADAVDPVPFSVSDSSSNEICQLAPCSYAATCGPDSSDVAGQTGAGLFYRNSSVRMMDIWDGASQTLMIGERSFAQTNGTWTGVPAGAVTRAGSLNVWPTATGPAPTLVLAHTNWINGRTDADGGLDDYSSNHDAGANFLFADGSVHFLANIRTLGPTWVDFQALGTRDGGEIISSLDY